jgi:hypothetical protein
MQDCFSSQLCLMTSSLPSTQSSFCFKREVTVGSEVGGKWKRSGMPCNLAASCYQCLHLSAGDIHIFSSWTQGLLCSVTNLAQTSNGRLNLGRPTDAPPPPLVTSSPSLMVTPSLQHLGLNYGLCPVPVLPSMAREVSGPFSLPFGPLPHFLFLHQFRFVWAWLKWH